MAPRGTRPLKLQRLELLAELDDAVLADVEGVVIEKDFLHLRKMLQGALHFFYDVIHGAGAPGVPGNGLRPHAEGAKSGATTRAVERDERIKQERHVVAFDLEVALVDIGSKRQGIEFRGVQLRLGRVVNDLSIFAVAGAENILQRLAVGVVGDGVIEFAAHDEVNVFAGVQGLIRLDVAVRTDKGNFQGRVSFLDFAQELDVAVEANSRGEQNQEFIVLANVDGLLPIDFVRGSVQQTAAGDHPGGIREPYGVPVGLNLARRGPPRTSPAVEILETRRV